MKQAEPIWTTWWSKAQRGMALQSNLYASKQEVHIKLPACTKIRFRFSAFYDTSSITITNASFYRIQDEKKHKISFDKQKDAVIEPLSSIVCDPITTCILNDEEIILTYEIHSDEGCMSGVSLLAKDEVSSPSNLVYGFHGVDVVSDEVKGCICVFGDSIVEQSMYTKILRKKFLSLGYVVLNAGISGNRLLRHLEEVKYPYHHGDIRTYRNIPLSKQCFGIAGVQRFYRDVISTNSNIHHVFIAIGINDLYQPGTFCASDAELPTINEFKKGYQSLFSLLHVPYTICGITPFYEAISRNKGKETQRMQMNEWLKKISEDANFITFDDVFINESKGLQTQYYNEDGLHPNKAGGKIMAEKIYKEMRGIR